MKFADSSSNSSYEDASDVKFSQRIPGSIHNQSGIQSYLEMLSNSFRGSSEPVPERSTFVSILDVITFTRLTCDLPHRSIWLSLLTEDFHGGLWQ